MKKIILVVGATASGKSRLGVDIAKKFNGEVISCDSMQIYRRMNIGNAKIKQEEMSGTPHHMIDVVEPDEQFSVGEYSKSARKIIDDIIAEGKVAVVVGGTGLYVDSILYPMSFGGNKDLAIRSQLEKDLEKYGKDYMYSQLARIDPTDAQKIHPNNTVRVLRALEIYMSGGKCKSDLKETQKEFNYRPLMIALDVDRDLLYRRINSRVDKMIEDGLIDEIRELLSSGVDFSCQSMQAIGYKEFKGYFDNVNTLEETIENIKKNTRNYAKRQITWFKRYDFAKWFDGNNITQIYDEINRFLKGV